jgi:hypothetical protein
MKRAEAYEIFYNLDSVKYDDQQKGTAIYEIINMATHNSITKDDLLCACRYLLSLSFDIPEQEKP